MRTNFSCGIETPSPDGRGGAGANRRGIHIPSRGGLWLPMVGLLGAAPMWGAWAADTPAAGPVTSEGREAAPPSGSGDTSYAAPSGPVETLPGDGQAEPTAKNDDLRLPSYTDVFTVYGAEGIQGRGNEWKFKQYHTPLSRPVLRIFEWQNGKDGETTRLALVQPGQVDQGGSLEYRIAERLCLARFGFTGSSFEFHPDLTLLKAKREEYRSSLTFQSRPNGPRLGAFFRSQDLSRDPDLRYQDFKAQDAVLAANLPKGRWNLDLSATTRKVDDRRIKLEIPVDETTTFKKPLRLTSRAANASLQYRFGSRASVRTTLSTVHGRTSPDANTTTALNADGTIVALDAVAMPTRRMTVRGKLRHSRFTRNIVGTGYGRGDSGGQIDVKYLMSRQILMRAGWQSREILYHNRADLIERPKVESAWVGAAFRPFRAWELRGQWENRKLRNNPFRVPTLPNGDPIVVTDEETGSTEGSLLPLVPDRMRRAEVRLSGPLPRYGGITAGWFREKRENRLRIVDYSVTHQDVTFWQPLTRRWTLTGTWTRDRLSGSQAFLQPWLSSNRVLMGSLTGTVGRKLTLSLLGTEYHVTGAFPSKSHWYAVSARRRLTDRTDAEVRVQRETFTDEVTDANSFRATTYVLEGRTRF